MQPHILPTEETYFDKPRIIRHVKVILAKLRRKKIHVDDIVEQINAQGIAMTRARFEDLFTSRPARVTIATPATVIAFLNVCFAFDNQIISAKDMLDLADAARLPLRLYDQLSIHFSTSEWQAAWFDVLPTTKPQLNRHKLIHRHHEFTHILQACSEMRHILITGESGIGKTALAQSLVIELEMLNRTRIGTVYLQQPLKSLGDLIKLAAQALNIKPLNQEPIELRMESVLNGTAISYLLLDNMQLTETEINILSTFCRQFSSLRLLITTPTPHHAINNPLCDVYVEQLQPLADHTTNSPAMMLFIQALSAYGVHYRTDDLHLLHSLCKQAQGNPRQILQMASKHTTSNSTVDEHTFRDNMVRMNPTELSIFSFLNIIDEPISHHFLLVYMSQHIAAHQLEECVNTLIQHNMVERIYGESQYIYRIPQQVRVLVNQHMPAQQRLTDYEYHITQLGRLANPSSLDVMESISYHDMTAVLGFAQRAVAHHAHVLFDVAKLIVQWLQIWLYHDAASHVLVFAEQILMQHRVVHPALAELCVAIGRMYNIRGHHDQTERLHQLVCQFVSPQYYPHIWAQSMIVSISSAIYLHNHAVIAQLQPLIPQVLDILEAHQQRDWLAYAYHILANMHSMNQDITQALVANEHGIQYSINRTITAAYVFTNFQRSLLYMYTGSYDMAMAVLNRLQDDLKPFDVPYFTVRLQMRLAAIEALMHNLPQAVQYCQQSFAILKNTGNLGELLFVADIYSLILYRQARHHDAVEVSNLCTKLRHKYGHIRTSYIEQLVQRKYNNVAPEIRAHVPPPAPDSTIYDLISQLSDIYLSMTPAPPTIVA